MLWLQWLRFLQSWAFHKWCSSLWNQITAIPTWGVVAWLAACSSKPQDFTLRWSRVPGLRTWPSFTNYSANSACDADELNLGPGTLVSAVQIWLWIPHLILHSVLLSQLAKLYRNSTVNSYPVSVMCQPLCEALGIPENWLSHHKWEKNNREKSKIIESFGKFYKVATS